MRFTLTPYVRCYKVPPNIKPHHVQASAEGLDVVCGSLSVPLLHNARLMPRLMQGLRPAQNFILHFIRGLG